MWCVTNTGRKAPSWHTTFCLFKQIGEQSSVVTCALTMPGNDVIEVRARHVNSALVRDGLESLAAKWVEEEHLWTSAHEWRKSLTEWSEPVS